MSDKVLKLVQWIEKDDGTPFTEEEMNKVLDTFLDAIDGLGLKASGSIGPDDDKARSLNGDIPYSEE